MRWRTGRRSSNIEDRRGRRRVGRAAGVGGGAIVIALIATFITGDPTSLINAITGGGAGSGPRYIEEPQQVSAEEQTVKDFLAVVLADTEDTWGQLFKQAGVQYQPPKMVLYSGQTPTACGQGRAASGPFYCPGDQKLYLDLAFLSEMKRMGAQGDFALAYVVAHEIGHHVQTVAGTAAAVRNAQAQSGSQVAANQLQVRMELQADCLAGVWAHHAHKQRAILEEGDLEEGMRAAAAVGDDHIQRQAGRHVVPESFTHGSSEQRVAWLKQGLQTGDINACETFKG